MATSSAITSATTTKFHGLITTYATPAAIMIVVFGVYLPEMWIGLSCDEFHTAWSIRGTLSDIFEQASKRQGFSPLMFVLMWTITKFFGQLGIHHEVVLRIIPFVFVMFSALALWYIVKMRWDRQSASVAVLLYLGMDQVVNAGVHARPYSLGLLSIVMAFLCLELLAANRKRRFLVGFIVFGAGCIYSQFLYSAALLVLFLRFLMLVRAGILPFRQLVLSGVGILLVASPLLPQIVRLFSIRSVHEFARQPTVDRLIFEWLTLPSTLSVLTSVCLALLVSREAVNAAVCAGMCGGWLKKMIKEDIVRVLIFWYLLPHTFLYLFSKLSGTSVFIDRYAAWSAPAYAILVALILRKALADYTLSCFAIVFALFTLGAEPLKGDIRFHQGWKEASLEVKQIVRASDLTLAFVPLAGEISKQEVWSESCQSVGCFIFGYYDFGLVPYIVPYRFVRGSEEEEQWVAQVKPARQECRRVNVIVYENLRIAHPNGKWILLGQYILARLQNEGFKLVETRNYDSVSFSILEPVCDNSISGP